MPFVRMVFKRQALKPCVSRGLLRGHGFRLHSIQPPFLDQLPCIKYTIFLLYYLYFVAILACDERKHWILRDVIDTEVIREAINTQLTA